MTQEDSSSYPKYKQIIDFMKGKIARGEWPIGSKIPSQRKLAAMFEVNRSTVITALDELTADGLIEGKMGTGTIVINNTWTLLATNPPDWNVHVKSGMHRPSQAMVQDINESEFNSNLIQLSKGELSPDIFPKNKMKYAVKKVAENMEVLGYEEPKGYFPLRKGLSIYMKTIGIEASPDSILIVSGALQALQLISIGLLQKNSSVLLEKPSYLYSLHVFQSAGMKLKGLPMDEEGIKVAALKQADPQEGQAILYTNPCFHNPTGTLMSQKRRYDLLKECEEHQLPIIEDDLYRELWLDERPPLPLKALDKNGHVLYVSSLSKTLSPGLRIGWIVGPEPVIERLADIKMQTDYGSSSLSQRVAAEWFKNGLYQQHMETVRTELRTRRKVMLNALETYAGDLATWTNPEGGFFIWVHIQPSISMKSLYSRALKRGILLNSGSIYAQETGSYLRLSYAYASLPDIDRSIKILAELIRELQV
ncbi:MULTISPECIES: PLP-dependent aminotransferase family protein [Priestia]|uniref:MocR-like pyridoxine biosynthesis transcription factor PdxR n=1 Tax=Priestia TaxID=2800373 RepID=UPI0011BB755D|nr:MULTISPECIES: PLP-dependent aminotransferase family protein [Priestia]MED5244640.1 PLP-dependent aminotransferase family protein [Priestia sp. LL-8]QDZ80479.1 PLP-dependent aminotransferase family protein [Priestia megaterium]